MNMLKTRVKNSYDRQYFMKGVLQPECYLPALFVLIFFYFIYFRHRHCPSRDDEDHVCCDWEIKTYQQTIEYCRKCQVTPTDPSDICYYRKRYRQGILTVIKI